MWQIARNRWARWAQERYGAPMEDIDALTLPGLEDVEQSAIEADERRRIWRELAFIRSEYRTLLLAHYFEGKSISVIAQETRSPIGTVKTRLARGRRMLKEGMEMAREFGRRSFAPENVEFVNSCQRFGGSGQPWTILEHLLYKNIFLEVYGNPETAEELSLELGVAMPYMEEELEYLTRETFLTREEKRYQTAFPIIGREAQERIHERYEEIVPELTALLIAELDAYAAACERIGEPLQGPWQSWEDAKWTLLMRAVDIHGGRASEQRQPRKYTMRPDGGQWDIIGFQTVDVPMPQRVGQHGGYLYEQENLPFVYFSAYRFAFRKIQERTKHFYDHPEIAALKLVCEGKAELCEPWHLDKLSEYGLIRRDGDGWAPTIVVLAHGNESERFERFTAEERNAIRDFARRIDALMKELHDFSRQAVMDDLPEVFRGDERLREIVEDVAVNNRGYVLEQAFREGWLKDDEKTSRVIGAWIER